MASEEENEIENLASAGHKLGQLVGDWFAEYFVLPLLREVADRLMLYLDHQFKTRSARGERVLWRDQDGNEVDYDFVMEVGGTDENIGIPVAFFECCWRRGTRHSKDKARDDSGKLVPMRQTYPTAMFLGMVISGDFTMPSREMIQSRGIDLLYIPKAKVVAAFEQVGLQMDYSDRSREEEKARVEATFQAGLTQEAKRVVGENLLNLIGPHSIQGYLDRVRGALRALPQEIRFISRKDSTPQVFESIEEATSFLENPAFDFSAATGSYVYQITFSDGREFERTAATLDELKALHQQIIVLTDHLSSLSE